MTYPPQPGAPAPGAPPPGAPHYGAAPRRRSVWPWLLGGCGGCLVLALIVMIVLGTQVSRFVGSVAQGVGPVTQSSVQQSLGDVPLYPKGTLDTTVTQATLIGVRAVEKAAGKQPGGMFQGVAVLTTTDDATTIFNYYDTELRGRGWQQVDLKSRSASQQRAYRKGNEMVMIQVQPGAGGNQVMIMRGGPDLAQNAPGGGSR